MRTIFLLFATTATLSIGMKGIAQADKKMRQVGYVGVHPFGKGQGKGMCHIEASHVHAYEPSSANVQFRQYQGAQFFVGDPVAYGWDGPRVSYMGHHPIAVDVVLDASIPQQEFCFLTGPHFHSFAPAPALAADFNLTGDAYFYIGTPPPMYIEQRPAMLQINAEYQAIKYERPVISVTPPSAWIGIRFAVPQAEVRAAGRPRGNLQAGASIGVGVVVPMPSVRVDVRLPSFEISGGAGVFIGGGTSRGKHGKGHDKQRGKGHDKHGD
jgi:hypothetical protein